MSLYAALGDQDAKKCNESEKTDEAGFSWDRSILFTPTQLKRPTAGTTLKFTKATTTAHNPFIPAASSQAHDSEERRSAVRIPDITFLTDRQGHSANYDPFRPNDYDQVVAGVNSRRQDRDRRLLDEGIRAMRESHHRK